METQLDKTSNKKKFLVIPLIAIMGIALAYAASIYISSTHTDVTVNEALTTTPASFTFALMPGETYADNFTITNAANVPLKADINWVESTNTPTNLSDVNLTYSTNMPQTSVVLAPGPNVISLNWTVDTDSTIGTFDGDVIVTRVA